MSNRHWAAGVILVLAASSFTPAAAAEANRIRQVFFGNLHAHTSYSDGSGTPRDAFA
jgi:hypothetical protein